MTTNIQTLNRRIDRLLLHIDSRLEQLHSTSDIRTDMLSLLGPDEQEQFRAFLDTLPAQAGHVWPDVRNLTDEQLDRYSLWLDLLKALETGDESQAERHRRWLSCSLADLIAMFRAIDAASVVDSASPYPFSVIAYRALSERVDRDQVSSLDMNIIRQWCELARCAV